MLLPAALLQIHQITLQSCVRLWIREITKLKGTRSTKNRCAPLLLLFGRRVRLQKHMGEKSSDGRRGGKFLGCYYTDDDIDLSYEERPVNSTNIN